MIDRRTGRPIPKVRVLGDDGAPVPVKAFAFALGPGASEETRERFSRQSDEG